MSAPCYPLPTCAPEAHTHHSLTAYTSVVQLFLLCDHPPLCVSVACSVNEASVLTSLSASPSGPLSPTLSFRPAWRQFGGQCVVQTTSWSQCSRSCGMALSSRVTNDNAQCKLVKETRLCNIRPCSSMSIPVKVVCVCVCEEGLETIKRQ